PDIAFEPSPLPFPDAFETSALERRLGGFHLTPLRQGVSETVETFRTAAAGGRLDVDRLLGVS
ncbi:MAG TPA: hypothetical protein VGO86_19010, partial [Candidatus Dormibacteraeota bacterium]